MNRLKAIILRLYKVPPRPEPPPGQTAAVQVFRPGVNFFYYSLLKWCFKQVTAVVGLLFGLGVLSAFDRGDAAEVLQFSLGPLLDGVGRALIMLEVLAWGAFLLQLGLSFVLLRLDYEMRWYVVTDRSLRLREGILRVREQTMTFANIQNMTVRQGPIQRLLGIADLEVRTAGGGGKAPEGQAGESMGGQHLHLGYFRGIDNAREVRDLLWEGVRRLRDTGLGNPDEAESDAPVESPSPPLPSGVMAAAHEVLAEARELRQAAEKASRQTLDASSS